MEDTLRTLRIHGKPAMVVEGRSSSAPGCRSRASCGGTTMVTSGCKGEEVRKHLVEAGVAEEDPFGWGGLEGPREERQRAAATGSAGANEIANATTQRPRRGGGGGRATNVAGRRIRRGQRRPDNASRRQLTQCASACTTIQSPTGPWARCFPTRCGGSSPNSSGARTIHATTTTTSLGWDWPWSSNPHPHPAAATGRHQEQDPRGVGQIHG